MVFLRIDFFLFLFIYSLNFNVCNSKNLFFTKINQNEKKIQQNAREIFFYFYSRNKKILTNENFKIFLKSFVLFKNFQTHFQSVAL
jgi:hypothetical protein